MDDDEIALLEAILQGASPSSPTNKPDDRLKKFVDKIIEEEEEEEGGELKSELDKYIDDHKNKQGYWEFRLTNNSKHSIKFGIVDSTINKIFNDVFGNDLVHHIYNSIGHYGTIEKNQADSHYYINLWVNKNELNGSVRLKVMNLAEISTNPGRFLSFIPNHQFSSSVLTHLDNLPNSPLLPILKEYLKNNNSGITKRIKKIEEIAEFTHPGNWSFNTLNSSDYKCNSNAHYSLVIHFPEINIKNSRKGSHIIKDLYVALFFNNRVEHIGHIYGTRGSRTKEEISSAYCHSHLPSDYKTHWNGFCLGDDTPMSNAVSGIVADRWNPDNLEKLLLLLHSYVAWESLEGGPYITMSNITDRTSGRRVLNCPESSVLIRVYKTFISVFTDFSIVFNEFSNSVPKYEVVVNKEFTDSLFKMLVERFSGNSSVFAYKISEDNYVSFSNDSSQDGGNIIKEYIIYANNTPRTYIPFKGKHLVPFVNDATTNNVENCKTVNPYLINYIVRTLEFNLNNYQLKLNQYESER